MRRTLALILTLAALGGCSNAGYYGQAIGGHLSVMGRTRPIDELLADPSSSADLKQTLGHVLAMRDFASRSLGLPDNQSYRHYADLERPFAVWNVFAAPELSLTAKEWCFVFAGCVPYRGYFNRADAEAMAAQLRAEGYDVYVGGVTAYSTLGWFPDPLLNTMLGRTEPELAGVLFHELAHQKLYAKGDTAFNESFATAIEREGVRRWLAARKAEDEYPAYLGRQQQREEFIALVMRYRRQLESLYESTQDDQAKRSGKQTLLADMREQYAQLKKKWDGYSGYDKWMENLNNARFVSVGLYHDYIPAFEALLAHSDGDLNAFYAAAAKLAQLPPAERSAALSALSPKLKAQN